MSKYVTVEVVAEQFGNYKKGDTIDKMHESTAKAISSKTIKIIGDYKEAPTKKVGVATPYKGNTPKETKKIVEEKTKEINAEKAEEPKKKNWLGKDKN